MKQDRLMPLFVRHVLACTLALILPGALIAGDVVLQWDANTETDLAGYKVYYGTVSGSYGTPVVIGLQTTYTVSGLAPGTYYFAVTAFNTSGVQSGFSNEVSAVVSGTIDTTPPVISGVSSGSVAYDSAVISWTTNEASDTQVAFGLTTAYASTTTLNSSLVTSHSVTLTGLAASTTYHYQVRSRDAAGNLATSADLTFATPAQPVSTDINRDGKVDVLDLQVLSNVVLGLTPCPGSCDINKDGRVDVLDVQILANVILGVVTAP
jgi:Dockerin type I domain/Purple acid Phosphatase, N-terminal domain/Fibronectin type III domain